MWLDRLSQLHVYLLASWPNIFFLKAQVTLIYISLSFCQYPVTFPLPDPFNSYQIQSQTTPDIYKTLTSIIHKTSKNYLSHDGRKFSARNETKL
jgi:hypothetical protein